MTYTETVPLHKISQIPFVYQPVIVPSSNWCATLWHPPANVKVSWTSYILITWMPLCLALLLSYIWLATMENKLEKKKIQHREVTYNLVGVHDHLESMSNSQNCDIATKFIPQCWLNDGISLVIYKQNEFLLFNFLRTRGHTNGGSSYDEKKRVSIFKEIWRQENPPPSKWKVCSGYCAQ